MHWRRFAVSSIPIDDQKAFEKWVLDRWIEKDALLEQYLLNGRFPADDGSDENGEVLTNGSSGKEAPRGAGYIQTDVRPAHWYEVGQIFVVLSAFCLVINVVVKTWKLLF
jgi:Acyltransferase C-terminus